MAERATKSRNEAYRGKRPNTLRASQGARSLRDERIGKRRGKRRSRGGGQLPKFNVESIELSTLRRGDYGSAGGNLVRGKRPREGEMKGGGGK
jgi:hypothetical protein